MPHDAKELRAASHSTAAAYLAAGIDPNKSRIFMQSHVAGHTELTWLLGCYTPIGWLERMIQADLVPVGEDQKQHIELTRDVCERINSMFGGRKWKKLDRRGRGGSLFRTPEIFMPPAGARVMSLQDGTAKMSKSAENDNSRINMTDSPQVIAKKIKSCKTDEFRGLEWDNPDRPECQNLLTIYSIVTGSGKDDIALEVADMSWGEFKPLLADAVVEHLRPFQTKYNEVMSDIGELDRILAHGAEGANEVAQSTVDRVRDAMGFLPPLSA